MTQVLSRWRATYQPGEWVVLAGPTSLVVLQPLALDWSDLVSTLWQEVLASTSMVDLATQLVAFGIGEMPSLGAFFWTDEGMRSLVRGGVVVRDAATGAVVATGHGVQTWTEVGLGNLNRIRVETPSESAGRLDLPLLVGAVYASSVTLDASPEAAVRSPQGARGPQEDSHPEQQAPAPKQPGPQAGQPGNAPEEPRQPADGARLRATPWLETADTELMAPPVIEDTEQLGPEPPTEPELGPAQVARLLVSDGQQVDLDVPVRIGRAPSAARPGDPDTVLVTVPSPNSDISRTHLEIRTKDNLVLVTDLNSTNGTVLAGPQRARQRLPAGETVSVPVGSVLDLGDGVTVSVEPPH